MKFVLIPPFPVKYLVVIRICQPSDIERIYFIINQAAKAYQGFIPPDCYHEPYMPREEMELETYWKIPQR